jgi:hypothetical protein
VVICTFSWYGELGCGSVNVDICNGSVVSNLEVVLSLISVTQCNDLLVWKLIVARIAKCMKIWYLP